MDADDRIRLFATVLWEWFARHKRTLPWRDMPERDADRRAYAVLVSEVMLQQTQVPRVVVIFKRFLEAFPTAEALAAASNAQVILAWRGMGYNSRALRLRDAARAVTQRHGGRFPREMEELLAIKGIGPYTAAAIRNFAFGVPTPCMDTNIRRILHRVFVGAETPEGAWKKSDKALLPLAGRILLEAESGAPRKRATAQDWHGALMDFGSAVCTKRSPSCPSCPLNGICRSAFAVPAPSKGAGKERRRPEPGRLIAGRHVPNRIIRGRVVEALRDAEDGLAADRIGALVCIDWAPAHGEWLHGILAGLVRDEMIVLRGRRYVLRD